MKLNCVGSNSVLSVVEVEESYSCNLDHGPLLSDLVGNGISPRPRAARVDELRRELAPRGLQELLCACIRTVRRGNLDDHRPGPVRWIGDDEMKVIVCLALIVQ